jgi:hypothetical protein
MHVCTTLGSTAMRLQEKTQKSKNVKRKKITKVALFHVRMGRPYPTNCNVSLHIGLGRQLINHANLGGCRLRGLISAKG